MVIGAESGVDVPSSNSDPDRYFHYHTNTLHLSLVPDTSTLAYVSFFSLEEKQFTTVGATG